MSNSSRGVHSPCRIFGLSLLHFLLDLHYSTAVAAIAAAVAGVGDLASPEPEPYFPDEDPCDQGENQKGDYLLYHGSQQVYPHLV